MPHPIGVLPDADQTRPGALIAPFRLLESILFADDLPVVYLQNPKAGCTTVASALWRWLDRARGTATFKDTPHRLGQFATLGRMSLSPEELVARPAFSMVRNPYARALSAYISKLRPGGTWRVQTMFETRFGLRRGELPAFARFLELLEREPPEAADRHFGLQGQNLLQPVARIDHLFYLEDAAALADYLESTLAIAMPRFVGNQRGAVEKLTEFYDTETRARVARIYARDFELFGYSEDIAVQAPVNPIGTLPGIDGALAAAVAAIAGRPTNVRPAAAERFAALAGDEYLVDLMRLQAAKDERRRRALAERVARGGALNLPALEAAEQALVRADDPFAARFKTLRAEAIARLGRR